MLKIGLIQQGNQLLQQQQQFPVQLLQVPPKLEREILEMVGFLKILVGTKSSQNGGLMHL